MNMYGKFKTTLHSFTLKKEKLLPLLLVLIVSTYLLFYIWPTNINGDGAMHAFLTRKMVENGGLLDHIPFAVDRIDNGNLIYEPIPYPETVYVVWSVFYVLGGEQLLKLSCIFFASLTALCVFLLLRDVDRYVGFFAGFCVIVLNTLRFIMTPLIEQALLSAIFFTILFYYRSLKTQKLRYFLLTGVFLGLAVGVKQQGLLLFGTIFLHGLVTFGHRMIKNKKLRDIAPLLIILTFSILVSAFPIYEQSTRNGTIAPSGSFDFLPFYPAIERFFQPKVPVDYEADANLSKIVATEEIRKGMTLDNVAQQYLLFPVLYAESIKHYPIGMSLLFSSLALPLYFCGGLFLAKKDKQLFLLLVSVFLIEFLSTVFFRAAVFKYNVLGLSIIAIFLVTGVYEIKNLFQGLPKGRTPNFLSKKLSRIFVFFVLVILIMGNLIFVFPNWMDEGRQTDAYLRAYSELKMFIEENSSIPPDAMFLAPQGNFMFICERDCFWISSYGGAMVPTIFETDNQTKALYWLQQYNISYIVIEPAQTQRKGLYDYIPAHGLLDYIDNSDHFDKMFWYPSEEELLALYKVVYVGS